MLPETKEMDINKGSVSRDVAQGNKPSGICNVTNCIKGSVSQECCGVLSCELLALVLNS